MLLQSFSLEGHFEERFLVSISRPVERWTELHYSEALEKSFGKLHKWMQG